MQYTVRVIPYVKRDQPSAKNSHTSRSYSKASYIRFSPVDEILDTSDCHPNDSECETRTNCILLHPTNLRWLCLRDHGHHACYHGNKKVAKWQNSRYQEPPLGRWNSPIVLFVSTTVSQGDWPIVLHLFPSDAEDALLPSSDLIPVGEADAHLRSLVSRKNRRHDIIYEMKFIYHLSLRRCEITNASTCSSLITHIYEYHQNRKQLFLPMQNATESLSHETICSFAAYLHIEFVSHKIGY